MMVFADSFMAAYMTVKVLPFLWIPMTQNFYIKWLIVLPKYITGRTFIKSLEYKKV